MIAATDKRVKELISHLDWSLLKGSVIITIGMVVARGVGFVVPFLQARFFAPEDFGIIQYAMSLAALLSIGVQPIGQHVIARYIGMVRNDSTEKLHAILSNVWFVLAISFGSSLLLGSIALLIAGKFSVGVLVIFVGTCIFYTYWGFARAYLAVGRLTFADIGNNLVQVILLLSLVGMLELKSTTLAMLIQGLACLVPLAILQSFWPLDITFDRRLIDKEIAGDILNFSIPIWLSHAGFLLYSNVVIIFLERYMGNAIVGIFSLASTLSLLFSFFPTGLATFLMPKVAEVPRQRHKKLLIHSLTVSTLANIPLLIIYYFIVPWFVERLFGSEYLIVPELFILMAIVMSLNGLHRIATSVFVGSGQSVVETKSRFLIVLATGVGCWLLIPTYGVLGAAWAMLIGVLCGLALYGLNLWNYFRLVED